VVVLGGVPAGKPTAVQFPGTYPPAAPHLGATQLDHIEAFMPMIFVVGAVAAVVPPLATSTGRRFLIGTVNPSWSSPGKERTGEESSRSQVD